MEEPVHVFCFVFRRWPNKQFCRGVGVLPQGTIYFIETPQTQVPTTFAIHVYSSSFHYQESFLDVAEAEGINDI